MKLFKTYFAKYQYQSKATDKESKRWKYKPSSVTKNKDTYQNHCIIGNLAYDLKDERRMGMFLLNNITWRTGNELQAKPVAS